MGEKCDRSSDCKRHENKDEHRKHRREKVNVRSRRRSQFLEKFIFFYLSDRENKACQSCNNEDYNEKYRTLRRRTRFCKDPELLLRPFESIFGRVCTSQNLAKRACKRLPDHSHSWIVAHGNGNFSLFFEDIEKRIVRHFLIFID